ncbi:MAG: cupin domain-containing protein [Pseudomonadota bacterium]
MPYSPAAAPGADLTAKDIIAALDLSPHPEGGFYRETWRGTAGADGRAVGTAIYYMLTVDDFSHWHRVDADEIWHWYSGAPLSLSISPNGHDASAHLLGPHIGTGQAPQFRVPAGHWQSATSMGAWTLVGCTVSPGFEFSGFELAAPDWRPTPRKG